MLTALRPIVGRFVTTARLPMRAKRILASDRLGRLGRDPGPHAVVDASIRWLCRAQDMSATRDGGVARDYSLLRGWNSSYPETTGYIVPTFLDCARRLGDETLRHRARRMLDWLTATQFPEGGIVGGMIDSTPRVPVTFNTGQVLVGLAAGVRELGESYREPMNRAATWLRDTLDADGCWRRYPTPFAAAGEKAYETHVSWGLFEAARIEPDLGYGEAGLRQVDWALGKQRPNGWFDKCCLKVDSAPLTHTIGYALRGIIEAYRYAPSERLLESATRLANALADIQEPSGRLYGRYDAAWRPTVSWACLTGVAQIAICWLLLDGLTGERRYRTAALNANRYVRRTIILDGDPDLCGGVKGSFPIDGEYGAFQYLNWAAKFSIDANLLEIDLASP